MRKNFNPSEGSGHPVKSREEPPTYLRNIEKGKSKKKIFIPRKSKAGREIPITALYLIKEHPEGKKGETILVPVLFLGAERERVSTSPAKVFIKALGPLVE